MDEKNPLRNRVKELRARIGLRQADLADCVGITRQTIIAIEKGRLNPSMVIGLKIARMLREPVDYVFYLQPGWEQEPVVSEEDHAPVQTRVRRSSPRAEKTPSRRSPKTDAEAGPDVAVAFGGAAYWADKSDDGHGKSDAEVPEAGSEPEPPTAEIGIQSARAAQPASAPSQPEPAPVKRRPRRPPPRPLNKQMGLTALYLSNPSQVRPFGTSRKACPSFRSLQLSMVAAINCV